MDRDEWDYHWEKALARLHFEHGIPHFRARQLAFQETEKRFGPQPEKPKRVGGIKAALLRIVGRSLMPEGVKTFVRRWAVLISVLYLGAVALLQALSARGCEACGMIAGFVQTAFGLLSLTPDPGLGPEIAAIVAGALAVWGGSRKVASIVKKNRAAKSSTP